MKHQWAWAAAALVGLAVIGGEGMKAIRAARGIRNHNPGNIEYNARNNWRGQVGTDGRFVIFDSPLNGLRASAKLIKNKMKAGKTTIADLISSWAPPHENNTAAYVAAVARALGVDSRANLTAAHIPALLAAIVRHENGSNPYSAELIQQAVAAA